MRTTHQLLVVPFLVVLAAVVGCATITDVAYAPQPARIDNPREEARAIILSNTVNGCVSEPEVTERTLVVKFACSNGKGGVGNWVVRFDSVETIKIQQSGEWYRVLVHHKAGAGTEDFAWGSKNRADIERLADALTALSSTNAAAPPAAPAAPAAPATEATAAGTAS